MNSEKAAVIVKRLLSNAEGLKYGSASATVKIHDGRVVEVAYTTTESTREAESSPSKQ